MRYTKEYGLGRLFLKGGKEMKINWKLRLKNKTTLTALILGIVALVYQVLGVFGVVPSVSESEVTNIVGMVINILDLMGIVTDPTTEGIGDSTRALEYESPAVQNQELYDNKGADDNEQ